MSAAEKNWGFMKHMQSYPAAPKPALAAGLALGAAVAILIADFATKIWAQENLAARSIDVIGGFFQLRLAHNTGVAFGMMRNLPEGARVPVLATLSIAVLVFVVVYTWPLVARIPVAAVGAGGLVGGALGNLYERLTQGYVVDFLLFYVGSYRWPAFNIADIGIVCGLFGIAIIMLRADYIINKIEKQAGAKAEEARSAAPEQGGFTLLEVMVALAILSMGLFALINSQGQSIRMTNTIKYYSIASFLARSKMIDIENQLWEEGFGQFDKDLEGTFEEEGYPEIRWEAEIKKIELNPDLSMFGMGGGGDEQQQGADTGGGQAGLGITPDAQGMMGFGGAGFAGQVQAVTEAIAEQIRYCKLAVYWMDGSHERSFDVVTHFVNMPLAGDQRPEFMQQ